MRWSICPGMPLGIVDMIGANIGLAATLDLASCELQGQLRSPKVNDLC